MNYLFYKKIVFQNINNKYKKLKYQIYILLFKCKIIKKYHAYIKYLDKN